MVSGPCYPNQTAIATRWAGKTSKVFAWSVSPVLYWLVFLRFVATSSLFVSNEIRSTKKRR